MLGPILVPLFMIEQEPESGTSRDDMIEQGSGSGASRDEFNGWHINSSVHIPLTLIFVTHTSRKLNSLDDPHHGPKGYEKEVQIPSRNP